MFSHGPLADVELRVLERDDRGYPVEFTLDMAQEFRRGYADPDAMPTLAGSGDAFPSALRDWLLADENLQSAWAEIRGRAPRRRLRLRLDPPELSALPWELLRENDLDGGPRAPVSTSPETPLSRYLAGRGRLGTPLLERPVKFLVVISNPANLESKWGLTPIDAAGEVERLKKATAGLQVQLQVLDGPCTLSRIGAALRDGAHVLHFVGHGTFSERTQSAALFLASEDAPDEAKPVPAEELEQMFQSVMGGDTQAAPLRLVLLMSCETAKTGTGDVFRGLAPRLIRAGVPAVVAMQDLVPVQTAQRFSDEFYHRVIQHGQADLAVNEARAALYAAKAPGMTLPGYAIPALFMRLKEGRLFGSPGTYTPAQQRTFTSLTSYILKGNCIPIIGPRALEGLLPLPESVARELAQEFAYPLKKDRDDLGRVAQFAKCRDLMKLRGQYLWTLARALAESMLGRRITSEEESEFKLLTLNKLARQLDWGNAILQKEGPTLLHQLASLDLPLYLTTNTDPLLVEALIARGKKPRQEEPRWEANDGVEGEGEQKWRMEKYDAQNPVVFHLNGTGSAIDLDPDDLSEGVGDDAEIAARQKLIIAEDDRYGHMVQLARDPLYLPTQVEEGLAKMPLLFIGYDLLDPSFRLLLEGIRRRITRANKVISIGVQLDVEEEADRDMVRDYLRDDLWPQSVDICWGTTRQFVTDLVEQCTKARKGRP